MVSLHFCVEILHLLSWEASHHFGWSWGARVNPLDQQIPSVTWAQTLIRGAAPSTDSIGEFGTTSIRGAAPSTDPIGEAGKFVDPRETEC